jgi:hypothetical protein
MKRENHWVILVQLASLTTVKQNEASLTIKQSSTTLLPLVFLRSSRKHLDLGKVLVQIFGDLYKKRRINRGICNQS